MVDIKEPITASADCQDGEEVESTTPAFNSPTGTDTGCIPKSNTESEKDVFSTAANEMSAINEVKEQDPICNEHGKIYSRLMAFVRVCILMLFYHYSSRFSRTQ